VTFAITGANGFLGVHIIHHLLKQGHRVCAIIRPGASLAEFELVKDHYSLQTAIYQNLTWETCELYDVAGLEEYFQGKDYVMHLAGVISYLKKDADKLVEINQQYTANVVNVAKDAGIKKLLYCSSIAAISKNTKGEPLTESRAWDDEIVHSNYGYTKYLGECELWRAKEEGLATVAINPGIILGKGDWTKGSNKLFGNAKNGFHFYSRGITGWVGVQDVARIAEKLCLSDINGERYIVVSENKSFKEIADTMTAAMGTKKPRIEIKGLLYKVAYTIVAVKEFLGLGGMLSKETVRASIAVNHFDNTKVKKALDYTFEEMGVVISNSI
jgi:dihydroflavonol-4-reductase